jgi:hypothetical protein
MIALQLGELRQNSISSTADQQLPPSLPDAFPTGQYEVSWDVY